MLELVCPPVEAVLRVGPVVRAFDPPKPPVAELVVGGRDSKRLGSYTLHMGAAINNGMKSRGRT